MTRVTAITEITRMTGMTGMTRITMMRGWVDRGYWDDLDDQDDLHD